MHSTFRSFLRRAPLPAALALLLTLAGGVSAPVLAATDPPGSTDLSPTPVDITVSVAPNVAVTFDDSGSMSFGYMPDEAYNLVCKQYTDFHYNSVYYNPEIDYTVPLDKDGNSFPASNVQWPKVPTDGYHASLGFGDTLVDLSRSYKPTYRWNQDHNETNSKRDCSGNSNGAFYYDASAGKYVDLNNGTTQQKQNFANWYSYYRTRNLMTKTAMTQAFGQVSGDIRLVWQTIWPGSSSRPWSVAIDNNSTIDAMVKENPNKTKDPAIKYAFFDWLDRVESSNGTPDRKATERVGEFFSKTITNSNRLTTINPYWNDKAAVDGGTSLSCRRNYHILVTDGYWNESDSEVTAAARNSETSITGGLPDGKGYTANAANTYVYSNVNNGGNGINKKSLANIAFNYWATDLQPDIPNKVSPRWNDISALANGKTNFTDDAVYFNPKNDPATWQHLTQYVVTLGINGNLKQTDDPKQDDYKSLLAGSTAWPRAKGDTASALDDMWHAAINSRGAYFSARDPSILVASLKSILNAVTAGSNAAVSGGLNSSVLTAGVLSYGTGYNPTDWSGDIVARVVKENGEVDMTTAGLKWDAQTKLAAHSSRKIFTAKATGSNAVSKVDFTWANLDTKQKTALETKPYSDPANVDTTSAGIQSAQDRVAWLRGDQTKEGAGGFRSRNPSRILGAVINSQAKYVAYPANGYLNTFPKIGVADAEESKAGQQYGDFVAKNLGRPGTLYVGGNDGMLHAFDASLACVSGSPVDGNGKCTQVTQEPGLTAGAERWAYVPNAVYHNLSKLPDPAFTNRFVPTVDGSPVSRDVFFGGAWHTILVGGLRYGGRGVYALDVTDPDAPKTLWEFNSDSVGADPAKLDKGNNPANLGFTYGQPNIARLDDGTWVVLIPSGYFPTCDKQFSPVPCDSIPAAANLRSSLFVVDAGTGALIKEMRTPTGTDSYGLSSPVVGDIDSNQVDDVAYAGDLEGNVWRFDLQASVVTASAVDSGVHLLFKPATPGAQPITVMPRLFPQPRSANFVVVFGTGKYLTAADNVADPGVITQSVYGIVDKAPHTGAAVEKADLQQQSLTEKVVIDPVTSIQETVRGITNNAVSSTQDGWYIDLDVKDSAGKPTARGEKVVVTPAALFDTNRVLVSTLIPGGDDACDPTRDGALMVLDAATGGASAGLTYPNTTWSNGYVTAGARVKNPPTTGSLTVATVVGGGQLIVPGVNFMGSSEAFSFADALWRRRSWRELLNGQ